MSPAEREVRGLSLHKRFHVRTTLVFGALALVVLGAMAIARYEWTRDAKVRTLNARLLVLAVALAESVDPRAPAAALSSGDGSSRAHRAMVDAFAAVGADEADVTSIYVVVRDEGTWTRFAADWVAPGSVAAATIGERYDARRIPAMLAAFEGVPTVDDEPTMDAWGMALSGYAPIRDADGNTVAVVGVDVSAHELVDLERDARLSTLAVYGLAVLLLIAAGVLLGNNLRRPIEKIIAASTAIAAGDLRARVGLVRSDELGILARHFDRMTAGLEERERIQAMFGRYVNEEVARSSLTGTDGAQVGGQERDVTVLFVDLVRYAAVCEALEPAALVEMLEQYLSSMADLVEDHGGCVIEMHGDGLLAVFGAPSDLPDHPANGVRCGIAMKARMDELNEAWGASGLARALVEHGIDRVGVRIGLHTGNVVAGNIGGRTRMKYGVIGDTVNLAARIEALNERLGTTMLVSADVHSKLSEELASRAESMGEHRVKRRASPVAVYAF